MAMVGKSPVVLVNMPWALLRAPSIQLSTVKALLAKEDIPSQVFNFNLEWMQHLVDGGFAVKDYFSINHAGRGLGEWIFAIPPFREGTEAEVESYRQAFRGDDLEVFEKAG